MMTKDSIVAEVRAARERIAAACNFDIRKIVRRAQQAQAKSGKRVVSFEPRPQNRSSQKGENHRSARS
jgi:hypothetical protein